MKKEITSQRKKLFKVGFLKTEQMNFNKKQ